MPRRANAIIRDLDPEVSAPLRKARIATVAPRDLDELLEGPPEQDVTVPVAALRAWREAWRERLFAELVERLEVERVERAVRMLDDWSEAEGCVLWWRFPIEEPPYVGTPGDSDWPGYHTHWTRLASVPWDERLPPEERRPS